MADQVEDISIEYEEDGRLIVKELEKEILSKGAWTTIVFLYQELNRRTDVYNPPKVSIRRYKKIRGTYRQQSKFNISGHKQAKQVIEVLNSWLDLMIVDDSGA